MSAETSGKLVLIAASLLSAVLGTVHGFSVFLIPLELAFGANRSAVSLTYSLALIFITMSVFLGYRLYSRWPAPWFILCIAIVAAAGAVLAGLASSLALIWLGYGVIFGGANGFGYGFGLQFAARANPGREGMAMGVVTAAYALGAILAPIGFSAALNSAGFAGAMLGLAATIIAVGAISAGLVTISGQSYQKVAGAKRQTTASNAPMIRLWIGYGAATFAGLMVIGHAQGIAVAKGYAGANWHATSLISAFNLIGSLVAGRMIDRMSVRVPLVVLPGLSAAALAVLALATDLPVMALAIATIGFAYGGIIAAYPGAITKTYGANIGPGVYGKVFTAWGTAGLAGPWLAGFLFDLNGHYTASLGLSAGLAGVAAISAAGLRD